MIDAINGYELIRLYAKDATQSVNQDDTYYPLGSIQLNVFGRQTPDSSTPTKHPGWEECNGELILASDYPNLDGILERSGDSFILPNLNGKRLLLGDSQLSEPKKTRKASTSFSQIDKTPSGLRSKSWYLKAAYFGDTIAKWYNTGDYFGYRVFILKGKLEITSTYSFVTDLLDKMRRTSLIVKCYIFVGEKILLKSQSIDLDYNNIPPIVLSSSTPYFVPSGIKVSFLKISFDYETQDINDGIIFIHDMKGNLVNSIPYTIQSLPDVNRVLLSSPFTVEGAVLLTSTTKISMDLILLDSNGPNNMLFQSLPVDDDGKLIMSTAKPIGYSRQIIGDAIDVGIGESIVVGTPIDTPSGIESVYGDEPFIEYKGLTSNSMKHSVRYVGLVLYDIYQTETFQIKSKVALTVVMGNKVN